MQRIKRLAALAIVAGALVGLYALTGMVSAATFTVNSTDDAPDVNRGDGICATIAGVCTLRAAVQEAASGTNHTIMLPAGTFTFTIGGANEDVSATGDLDIPSDLTIIGAGAGVTIIDANGLDRAFQVLGGGTVQIRGMTIRNGRAIQGGAIFNSNILTLTDVALTTNNATTEGGAVYNSGVVTIRGSTLSGNRMTQGAIYNTDRMTITNSTISGNIATGEGGGIYSNGVMTISHTTITGNSAELAPGMSFGGISVIGHSIVAGNTAGQGSTAQGCSGSGVSEGYNIDDNNTCNFNHSTDLRNTDPMLGPLADNGGPTQTHLPLAGSPAIDAIPSCSQTVDQRGAMRVAPCDIGAVEVSGTPAPTASPTPTATASPTATATATASPTPTVTATPRPLVIPNSPYIAGLNAIVVQGPSPAADVAVNVSAQSGRSVQALWMLVSGQWLFYLPATPQVDGGLSSFPESAAVLVVLG